MTPPQGLSYDTFQAQWRDSLLQPLPVGDPGARRFHFYKKYNLERSARVEAAYTPSDALREALAAIGEPQTWWVLTEDWCVDSAYSLPVIARAAALSPRVSLVVLPRDAHPDIMDRYLTNGGRSIPKLVAFDATGAERFQWGPRPARAAAYRQQLIEEGREKGVVSALLVEWYEAEGWLEVERELVALINAWQPAGEIGKVR